MSIRDMDLASWKPHRVKIPRPRRKTQPPALAAATGSAPGGRPPLEELPGPPGAQGRLGRSTAFRLRIGRSEEDDAQRAAFLDELLAARHGG
jgi:hypothetical protein